MTRSFRHLPLPLALAGIGLLLGPAAALAAGFQLNETSASGLGNAFAGGAAVAEDASTLWSNVAGLSRLTARQGAVAVHLITPSIKFGDQASTPATQQALGGNGGDAGGLNVVPSLYLVMPVNDRWVAGVGVTAPWGLVTEYDNGWIGRFQASKSSIQTLNINPGLSFKATPRLALGFGLNVQRMVAEFTNQVNYSAALLSAATANGIAAGSATFNAIAAATPGLESAARIKGSDNAWGWNAGVLWDIDAQHRVGLHYRSSIRYHLDGSAHFDNPTPVVSAALAPTVGALAAGVNAAALYDGGVHAAVKLPPIANLSYFGALTPRWDLMADLQWTGWSTIETLRFVRSDGSVLQSTPENFRDTWKLAVGANYRPGGDWLWRMGLAIDQSPVRDAYRTPRLPDQDRTWLAFGAQYQPGGAWRLDFGAAYLWIKHASINANGGDPTAHAAGLLNGRYDSNTVIVSAQASYGF
jgi:long-chain fatty acid transport protein